MLCTMDIFLPKCADEDENFTILVEIPNYTLNNSSNTLVVKKVTNVGTLIPVHKEMVDNSCLLTKIWSQ
jgi:hypothetical protein